jgi:polar amino acid transport system permease protein
MVSTPEPASTTPVIEVTPNVNRRKLSALPWWAFFMAGLAFLLVILIVTNQDYRETFLFLKDGLYTTLYMTFFGFIISIVIGLVAGLARTSKNVVIYNIATWYVEAVRGIPLIVIILVFAFGVVPGVVEVLNKLGLDISVRDFSYTWRAIIALSFGYGAFEAEVIRAGIESISRGQMEAARSLGMTYPQAMRYIILPQAIRRVLPPLGNDFIALLKDSSLATVLAVPELTQLGRLRRASTFRAMETFYVMAFLYLAMTLVLSAGVRTLERLMKYDD